MRRWPQNGGAALTTRAVAVEAGISPGSFYELFSSQDAVRAAVMREVADRIRHRIEELPADLSGRPWAGVALRALLPLKP